MNAAVVKIAPRPGKNHVDGGWKVTDELLQTAVGRKMSRKTDQQGTTRRKGADTIAMPRVNG